MEQTTKGQIRNIWNELAEGEGLREREREREVGLSNETKYR